jgi:superfamily II DNA or RNA helicase
MTSEGIDFKNVTSIHIMDPHWNYSRLDQIIGRAIRYASHSDLAEKDRVVNIYKYASVYTNHPKDPKTEYSIDLLKYGLSIEKDRAIAQVQLLLKELAIDCGINKINFTREYDYSRICHFAKCNVPCKGTSKRTGTSKKSIDSSTYSLELHNAYEFKYIKEKVYKLLGDYKLLDLAQIIKLLPEIKYKENIYIVLDWILNNDNSVIYNDVYYIKKN